MNRLEVFNQRASGFHVELAKQALDQIYSEDFQDGRIYGTVTVVNPFRGLGPAAVHEARVSYGERHARLDAPRVPRRRRPTR